MGNGRLVLGVDRELPLLVSGETDCGEVQRLRIADPSHGVERHVGGHRLAIVELDRRAPGFIHGDAQMLLSESDRDPILLHLGVQCLRDFLVQEPQQLSPPIDEGDSDSESGQHRGILCADDTPSDDDDAGWVLGRAEKRVGVANDHVVKWNLRGTAWS